MTDDEIYAAALATFKAADTSVLPDGVIELARLIEQRTIERCAKWCEERALIYGDTETGRARRKTALACAAAIRALLEQPSRDD